MYRHMTHWYMLKENEKIKEEEELEKKEKAMEEVIWNDLVEFKSNSNST